MRSSRSIELDGAAGRADPPAQLARIDPAVALAEDLDGPGRRPQRQPTTDRSVVLPEPLAPDDDPALAAVGRSSRAGPRIVRPARRTTRSRASMTARRCSSAGRRPSRRGRRSRRRRRVPVARSRAASGLASAPAWVSGSAPGVGVGSGVGVAGLGRRGLRRRRRWRGRARRAGLRRRSRTRTATGSRTRGSPRSGQASAR